MAEEYRRKIKVDFPEIQSDAWIYVKEVRKGSYEADLIPYLYLAAPLIANMDQVLIAEQFVRTWGARITSLVQGSLEDWNPARSELASFTNATVAIANDPNGISTL